MRTVKQQSMFPQMYTWVLKKIEKEHMRMPTVIEVLAYIMVMTGDDVTKLIELLKEMESNNE